MSLHVFANVLTPFGTASNNRGETEGNTTTLQKLIWHGRPHTTVSAEAIRFALRRLLADKEEAGTNRRWNEDARANDWRDREFKAWAKDKKTGAFKADAADTHIDDDLMGFMSAEAAKEDAARGTANVRRAVLEVTRAVSLTPWSGDVVFNAASPRATPSAAKGEGNNPVPYMAEIHATRYQFGLALTPEKLRVPERAVKALEAVGELSGVAGNQARFLYDFAPDAVVLRLTADPAPRLLYCFETDDDGTTFTAGALVRRVECGDVEPAELIVGTTDADGPFAAQMRDAGVKAVHGPKAAVKAACERVAAHADVAGAKTKGA